MHGIHDLGGRQGFGAIPHITDEQPFQSNWESRAFGIAQSSAGDNNWNIDWFRYCRELINPVDYLTTRYFDQWMVVLAAQMIEAGYVDMGEIKSGIANFVPDPGYPPDTISGARAYVKNPISFSREMTSVPLFKVGQIVRCKSAIRSGHTRLPRYARGRHGAITSHHGGHVLPEASAMGERLAEHLYTVSFSASELWPEAAGRNDYVYIDLWESYLELT